MDSTRFSRDEDLYASVLLHLSKNCTGITSASCLAVAVTAAMHTVLSAIADFSEAWNTRSQSLLSALPNELLVACFEWLPQRSRVIASGVSRGWRAILLGTPKFWTRIYGPVSKTGIPAVLRLQNMIQRSGSALIDISWTLHPVFGMADARLKSVVLDLFSANMPRIRSLEIHTEDVDAILTVPGPRLESLTISNGISRTRTSIPVHWLDSNAPVMRSLSMRDFELPSALLPLRNIEVFRGSLPPSYAARTLFQLFPSLKDLTLFGINNTAQLPELAPPTLSHIDLSAPGAADLDAVLANWTYYPAGASRSIRLSTYGRLALDASIEHLARVRPSAAPDVSIRCRGLEITLSTRTGYEINLYAEHKRSRVYDGWAVLGGSAHIGAVRALHLTDTMLMPVLRADLEFPGVVEMSILAGAAASKSEIALASARNPPALRVPRLRTLAFEIVGQPRASVVPDLSTAARLPEFVAQYIRHGSHKLESITIIQKRRPAWKHVCGLLADSETLYYCATGADKRQEMRPPPEQNAPLEVWAEAALNAASALLELLEDIDSACPSSRSTRKMSPDV